ncbi:hypothetical protein Q8A73_002820 [Channa argus]|nr:hypothetical protein Q8A73_002820 [Channa argus]
MGLKLELKGQGAKASSTHNPLLQELLQQHQSSETMSPSFRTFLSSCVQSEASTLCVVDPGGRKSELCLVRATWALHRQKDPGVTRCRPDEVTAECSGQCPGEGPQPANSRGRVKCGWTASCRLTGGAARPDKRPVSDSQL